jgi:hypothetical protein
LGCPKKHSKREVDAPRRQGTKIWEVNYFKLYNGARRMRCHLVRDRARKMNCGAHVLSVTNPEDNQVRSALVPTMKPTS